jgi:hypothetical protein
MNSLDKIIVELKAATAELKADNDRAEQQEVCIYCKEPREDKIGCCQENHWEILNG